MSTAKKSKSRTVIGASFNDAELKELDRQRAQFGSDDSGRPKLSRGGAVKLLWEKFGDDTATTATQQHSRAVADAKVAQPLIDALGAATKAWNERAHQRRMIGANQNQITRHANTLFLLDDDQVSEESIGDLINALQGVERALGAQFELEREDDQLLATVRAIVDRIGSTA